MVNMLEQTHSENGYHRFELKANLFRHITQPIIVTDLRGKIQLVNPAFSNMSGYLEEELIGQKPSLWKSEFQDEIFYEKMWDSLLGLGKWQGVLLNRRKDGHKHPQWVDITAVENGFKETIGYVASYSDLSSLKSCEEMHSDESYYDMLTGIGNRNFLQKCIGELVEDSQDDIIHSFAVIIISLSNFQMINETLGHKTGDLLLKNVVQRLEWIHQDTDIITRYSGKDFAVLVPMESGQEDSVKPLASRIIDDLSQVYMVGERKLFVSVNLGISLFPNHGYNSDSLIQSAETAMQYSKRSGRNNFHFYSEDIFSSSYRRLTLESHLHQALENEEFRLLYQPQVHINSGRIMGLEALVYWDKADSQKLTSPGEFILAAEECGLIVPIGEWVLQEACRQSKVWQDKGYPKLPMSVNFSPVQFKQGNLLQMIDRVLANVGLDPAYLEIELTETALMDDLAETIKLLKKIKDRGIKIAIDDFGIGYSSLNYLKQFPIDKLKLDRSFIKDITSNANDAAIVKSIIEMGQSMGMEVVAEGVENEEQLSFLRFHQCDRVQGYYYSKPAESTVISNLLSDGGFMYRDI